MPNIKSAKKRLRQTKVRTMRNRQYKNRIKVLTRQVNQYIEAKNKQSATEMLPSLFKAIDKATKKHILHRNTASRRKSLVSRRINHIDSTANENNSQAK